MVEESFPFNYLVDMFRYKPLVIAAYTFVAVVIVAQKQVQWKVASRMRGIIQLQSLFKMPYTKSIHFVCTPYSVRVFELRRFSHHIRHLHQSQLSDLQKCC